MEAGFDRALRLVALRQEQRRSFNERLAALSAADYETDRAPFRCECGLISCGAIVRLTGAEYAAVRANAEHFVVFAAHVVAETETVIANRRGWSIVAPHARPVANPADVDASLAWTRDQTADRLATTADRDARRPR